MAIEKLKNPRTQNRTILILNRWQQAEKNRD
jgi:hypothetical protein